MIVAWLNHVIEKFIDPDLYHTAMKPDNIKRRSKKRRPDDYYRDWEREHIVKAKDLKMNIQRVRKRIDKYMKAHP